MKIFVVVIIFIIARGKTFAQKPPIVMGDVKNWPTVGQEAISNDGNYVNYYVSNRSGGNRILIIQSTSDFWKKELIDVETAHFSNDSKMLLFKTGKDSLCMLTLGKNDVKVIIGVDQYSMSGDWIIYVTNDVPKGFVFLNLIDKRVYRFSSLSWYQFTDAYRSLYFYQEQASNQDNLRQLDLLTGNIKNIWSNNDSSVKAGNFSLRENILQLAFIVGKKQSDHFVFEGWYYEKGMDTASMIIDGSTRGIEVEWALTDRPPEFSKNGNAILFGIQKNEVIKPNPDAVPVDIWSYKDKEFQSLQLREIKNNDNVCIAVYGVIQKKLILTTKESEEIISSNEDYLLVMNNPTGSIESFEEFWNIEGRPSYYLISLKNGSRKLLLKRSQIRPAMSPSGKWIVYYDFKIKNFMSYELKSGIVHDITSMAHTVWTNEEDDHPVHPLCWTPWQQTWLANDRAVLISDTYDIWQIDPAGIKAPINLTNYIGRKHKIRFQLVYTGTTLRDASIDERSSLLIKAVNLSNKDRGFYNILLDKGNGLKKLSMGPYVYDNWMGQGSGEDDYEFPPVKAKSKDAYLVYRETAFSNSNLFFTTDFRTFKKITDFQPQNRYNWLTSELVHWKAFDGSTLTGLLYKPENFDSFKKYPLIVHYYEKRSGELNLFITPNYFGDAINIPWFVSNGYIVFVPDINYKTGDPGVSAYNSIVSGAKWLSKKPWINEKKMGLQGHSFGGYETNYVISHSHTFAAACSASGFADLISWYGSDARGTYPMFWAEYSQGRMGTSPWLNQSAYIRNSPIFKADQITTPLLMMNNKEDGVVPFAQGVQFFSALRRMGKRVWMLQYDNGNHSTSDDKDFSTRVIQFFDYYLKGAPAPIWMTKGIPASRKGIDDGLRLDYETKTQGTEFGR